MFNQKKKKSKLNCPFTGSECFQSQLTAMIQWMELLSHDQNSTLMSWDEYLLSKEWDALKSSKSNKCIHELRLFWYIQYYVQNWTSLFHMKYSLIIKYFMLFSTNGHYWFVLVCLHINFQGYFTHLFISHLVTVTISPLNNFPIDVTKYLYMCP